MALSIVLLGLFFSVGCGLDSTAKQYSIMPALYWMDDYDICMETGGTYCLGSFVLRPRTQPAEALFDTMIKHSMIEHNFNHTILHRGYCTTERCSHIKSTPSRQFERCVSENTLKQYGFDAKLFKLDYCENQKTHEKNFGFLEWGFMAVAAAILLMNIVGTCYDFCKNEGSEQNTYLMAWSLRANWNRLFANHDDGDPRLTALKSVQGIKAVSLALVMLAHTILVYNMVPVQNPLAFVKASNHWSSIFIFNGSVIVQGFFMLASFLFAYNVLLMAETHTTQISIRMLPLCIVYRLIRILPLYLFVLGLTGIWWPRSSWGALWTPLIREQAATCRRAWWTHLLFINNLYNVDDKCLLQSWFLAADMQVYIIAAALTLILAKHRSPIKVLISLIAATALFNFALAYTFGLMPIMKVNNKDLARNLYKGDPSFKWQYVKPWSNLPAALCGLLVAFLQRDIQASGYKLHSNKIFKVAYHLSQIALPLWVVGGNLVYDAPAPVLAAYVTLDKLGYALIGIVCMLGFFNGMDSIYKRSMEWSGWRPLGRMSLAVLLLHWNHHLTHMALNTQPSRFGTYEVAGHWYSVQLTSYATAIPLHLMVELPAQRFLQALLVRWSKFK